MLANEVWCSAQTAAAFAAVSLLLNRQQSNGYVNVSSPFSLQFRGCKTEFENSTDRYAEKVRVFSRSDNRRSKGPISPRNFWHILSFCALRGADPNKILLLA